MWPWEAFNSAVDGDELTFRGLGIHKQLEIGGRICREEAAACLIFRKIHSLNKLHDITAVREEEVYLLSWKLKLLRVSHFRKCFYTLYGEELDEKQQVSLAQS